MTLIEVFNAAFAAGALGYAIVIERRLTKLETQMHMLFRLDKLDRKREIVDT